MSDEQLLDRLHAWIRGALAEIEHLMPADIDDMLDAIMRARDRARMARVVIVAPPCDLCGRELVEFGEPDADGWVSLICPSPSPNYECSICRGHHGREVEHACE